MIDYEFCNLQGKVLDPYIKKFCEANKIKDWASVSWGGSIQNIILRRASIQTAERLIAYLQDNLEIREVEGPWIETKPSLQVSFGISAKVDKSLMPTREQIIQNIRARYNLSSEGFLSKEDDQPLSNEDNNLEAKKEKEIRHQRSIEIAKKMKQGNIPYDQIQKFTELTILEIERL